MIVPTLKLCETIRDLSRREDSHVTGCVNLSDAYDCNAIIHIGDYFIQLCEQPGMDENDGRRHLLIQANCLTKSMTMWTASSMESELEERSIFGWEQRSIVDLGRTGRYWEGGVLNGCECYGYGKEYNDDNNLVYEGFMFGGKRVCYGKEYRGIRDNKNGENGLVYEGGYLNGVRYGFGKLYDLNGKVEYEGEWMDNLPVENRANVVLKSTEERLIVCTSTEELTIQEVQSETDTVHTLYFLPLLHRLRRIKVEGNCFRDVCNVMVFGLEELQDLNFEGNDVSQSEVETIEIGRFSVEQCPNLCNLQIGMKRFKSFKELVLKHLDSLQVIKMGGGCFERSRECSMRDLPSLTLLSMGKNSFKYASHVQFENLPNLTTISLDGWGVLHGNYRDENVITMNGHKSYNNVLIMRNLPSLTLIQYDRSFGLFPFMGKVILENVQVKIQGNEDINDHSFLCTVDLQAQNAEGLANFIREKSKYI